MTQFQRHALQVLRQYGPSSASVLGAKILPGKRSGPGMANHGGGDYGAQMVLGRLRKNGWCDTRLSIGSSVWRLTPAGRIALEAEERRLLL